MVLVRDMLVAGARRRVFDETDTDCKTTHVRIGDGELRNMMSVLVLVQLLRVIYIWLSIVANVGCVGCIVGGVSIFVRRSKVTGLSEFASRSTYRISLACE